MIPQYYEINKAVRPIIFSRAITIFPGQTIRFDVESDSAEEVIQWAKKNQTGVLFLTQKDPMNETPQPEDYGSFGTIVAIRSSFRMPTGYSKVLAEGVSRAELTKIVRTDPYPEAEVLEYIYHPEKFVSDRRTDLLIRLTASAAKEFLQESMQIPESFLYPLANSKDPGVLADELAPHLDLRNQEALELLSELNVTERLIRVREYLDLMGQLAVLDQEIHERAQDRMQQSQKEYVLREQLNIIREELGESTGDPDSLVDDYMMQLHQSDIPDEIREEVAKEIEKLSYVSPMSPELNVIRSYLDTVFELPWGHYTKYQADLTKSRKILDRDHYGLKEVKERILEFIAVRQLRKDSKGSILCLVGPPGVGKTSIARSIAKSLNRKFTSMRLGGVTDESEIRGHRRTYIGAMPGRILSQMIKVGTMNPLFLFDEVDKIGSDFRGDPASALLEVLDPEQNKTFQDRFVEFPFDLSQVMFLTTANTTETIPGPLLDRMEVIRIPGYTEVEKFQIAKRYLLPKQRQEAGLTARQCSVADAVLREMISHYTREAGVRELERQIGKICRRTAKRIVEGKSTVRINRQNITEFLGQPKFLDEELERMPQIGVVNGLAWTEAGGEILNVEANQMPGHGGIQLTGSMGAVMKESAQLAISYLRANAKRYGLSPSFYAMQDLHIHMPEGAVPKDGPSAGVSIATALISVLTARPVRSDIAMTGEITLTGRVLPIGGVKEKILAAKRYHIMTVFLPKENMRDLKEIEEEIQAGMAFIPVSTLDEVVQGALLAPVEVKAPVIFQTEQENKKIGFLAEPLHRRSMGDRA